MPFKELFEVLENIIVFFLACYSYMEKSIPLSYLYAKYEART